MLPGRQYFARYFRSWLPQSMGLVHSSSPNPMAAVVADFWRSRSHHDAITVSLSNESPIGFCSRRWFRSHLGLLGQTLSPPASLHQPDQFGPPTHWFGERLVEPGRLLVEELHENDNAADRQLHEQRLSELINPGQLIRISPESDEPPRDWSQAAACASVGAHCKAAWRSGDSLKSLISTGRPS